MNPLSHFRKYHVVNPGFQDDFEAENSRVHTIPSERAETPSRGSVASSCSRETSLVSMDVISSQQSEHQPHSLSPVQPPAPVLEKL